MKKSNRSCYLIMIVGIVSVFALTGCASRKVKLTETGFLSSYANLSEDEESGMYIYRNSAVNIGERYSGILIAPVQFKLEASVNADKINDEEREELAAYFVERLEEGLSKNYAITDSAGEDVLIFRTAITNIVPNIGILNLSWISLFTGTGLGGASLEAELVDSLTGERILAFVDARKGRKFKTGFAKLGHAEEALGYWANVMVENLDRISNK